MNATLAALLVQARPTAGDDSWKLLQIAGLVVMGVFLLFVLVLLTKYAKLYVRSVTTNAGVGLLNMFAMSLRKVDPTTIVDAKVMVVQARIEGITTRDIEAHYLAGGNVPKVATAVIAAHKAGMDLPWRVAAAIDLAGRDVLDAVKTSVTPKVIDCPNPASGKSELAAVAKNGIQVLTKARVTVRTNIKRLVGGEQDSSHWYLHVS